MTRPKPNLLAKIKRLDNPQCECTENGRPEHTALERMLIEKKKKNIRNIKYRNENNTECKCLDQITNVYSKKQIETYQQYN